MGFVRDQEIAGGVVAALARDSRVNAADRVNVSVESGIVTLSGIVRSASEKTAAGEAAAQVPGVVQVDNALTVATDGTISDLELATAVADALARAPGVSLRDIGATVDDGIVTLVGHVRDRAQEEEAIRAAGSVKGVKNVVAALARDDQLNAVGLPLDDTTVRNQAMGALAESGLNLYDEEVHVAEGVVYLTGRVASEADRRRATEVLQHLVEVARVVNRLVLADSEVSASPDERLTALVQHALRRDGRANPSYVHVTAVGGVVYLAGQVDSIEQQSAAAEVTQRVPGVQRVVNDLLLADRTSEPSDDKGHPRADIQDWLQEQR